MKPVTAMLTTLCAAAVLICGATAGADLLLYDGFPAGGENPAADQYQSEPASTDGADNDALHGQAPDLTGFNTADAWSNQDRVAATVYPRVNSTGLEWSNDAETQFLITTEGSAEIFRDGTATGDQSKAVTRDTTGIEVGEEFFVSGLFQFVEGTAGTLRVVTGIGEGFGDRENFIGFNAAGNLVAGTDGDSGASDETFAADTAHLIIARFRDDSPRVVDLWANPADLTDPGAPDYTFAADHFSGFDVDAIMLRAETGGGVANPSFIFDEVRVGETFGSVTPWIPEPATMGLMGVGGLAVLLKRRR